MEAGGPGKVSYVVRRGSKGLVPCVDGAEHVCGAWYFVWRAELD